MRYYDYSAILCFRWPVGGVVHVIAGSIPDRTSNHEKGHGKADPEVVKAKESQNVSRGIKDQMDRHIEWTSQFTSSNKFSPAPLKVVEVLEQGILLGPFYVAGTEEELDRAV